MTKHVKPDHHGYVEDVQRFSLAIGHARNRTELVGNMLGAIVVSMNKLGPEELESIKDRIDTMRVWKP